MRVCTSSSPSIPQPNISQTHNNLSLFTFLLPHCLRVRAITLSLLWLRKWMLPTLLLTLQSSTITGNWHSYEPFSFLWSLTCQCVKPYLSAVHHTSITSGLPYPLRCSFWSLSRTTHLRVYGECMQQFSKAVTYQPLQSCFVTSIRCGQKNMHPSLNCTMLWAALCLSFWFRINWRMTYLLTRKTQLSGFLSISYPLLLYRSSSLKRVWLGPDLIIYMYM